MTSISLLNYRTGERIATSVILANSFWLRLRGLLGRPPLKPYEGLWLIPCQQVHMLGMYYSLSVWFINPQGEVCQIIDQLDPGKISPRIQESSSIIELPAGWAEKTGTQIGDTLLRSVNP
ncbi:DUF192 domain-containing protein [Desulfitobacterium sp.]|uniref:DUF192 domain-containing protein n=1 Tax=Desulfitobacterium sp. TaxID=49981 RepID=UPI002CAEDF08|nr:DUF192 domain-containing protein [Desulfitobacterium sp.]HVJ48572.1 DUF192 domain-containing protein [Desulfitobacterium sp.]